MNTEALNGDSTLSVSAVRKLANTSGRYSNYTVSDAVRETNSSRLDQLASSMLNVAPGRHTLSAKHPIDWDEDLPDFYQATTIAHGHLLHLKQVWTADGYSLGDLLYSLPLAPCEKKQIAVIDWERREQAAREESGLATESLSAVLTRDRDLSEILSATLKESMHGSSGSSNWGVGG